MATKKTIAQSLSIVHSTYSNLTKDWDLKTMAEIWYDLFFDIPDGLFCVGLKRSMKICTYPPTPADINSCIKNEISRKVPVSKYWIEAEGILKHFDELASCFSSTVLTSDGLTAGYEAKHTAKFEYEKLPSFIKDYFGSLTSLLEATEVLESGDNKRKLQLNFIAYVKERIASKTADEMLEDIGYLLVDTQKGKSYIDIYKGEFLPGKNPSRKELASGE